MEGIVAISVFNDSGKVIMMGDADSEVMKNCRNDASDFKENYSPAHRGPFVHMTIQIPAGNMIIAPYHDNYLCLLTTRTINIGHIRKDSSLNRAKRRTSARL